MIEEQLFTSEGNLRCFGRECLPREQKRGGGRKREEMEEAIKSWLRTSIWQVSRQSRGRGVSTAKGGERAWKQNCVRVYDVCAGSLCRRGRRAADVSLVILHVVEEM